MATDITKDRPLSCLDEGKMGSPKSHQDKAYFSFPTHCVFFKSYIIFGLFIFMQHSHYSALLMTPKTQEINTVFIQDQAVDTGQRPQRTCPADYKAVLLIPLQKQAPWSVCVTSVHSGTTPQASWTAPTTCQVPGANEAGAMHSTCLQGMHADSPRKPYSP